MSAWFWMTNSWLKIGGFFEPDLLPLTAIYPQVTTGQSPAKQLFFQQSNTLPDTAVASWKKKNFATVFCQVKKQEGEIITVFNQHIKCGECDRIYLCKRIS